MAACQSDDRRLYVLARDLVDLGAVGAALRDLHGDSRRTRLQLFLSSPAVPVHDC